MNQFMIDFEGRVGLGPTRVAALLGIAYITYAQYKSTRRELPEYHQRHLLALTLLHDRGLLEQHLKDITHGSPISR